MMYVFVPAENTLELNAMIDPHFMVYLPCKVNYSSQRHLVDRHCQEVTAHLARVATQYSYDPRTQTFNIS